MVVICLFARAPILACSEDNIIYAERGLSQSDDPVSLTYGFLPMQVARDWRIWLKPAELLKNAALFYDRSAFVREYLDECINNQVVETKRAVIFARHDGKIVRWTFPIFNHEDEQRWIQPHYEEGIFAIMARVPSLQIEKPESFLDVTFPRFIVRNEGQGRFRFMQPFFLADTCDGSSEVTVGHLCRGLLDFRMLTSAGNLKRIEVLEGSTDQTVCIVEPLTEQKQRQAKTCKYDIGMVGAFGGVPTPEYLYGMFYESKQ